MSSRVHSTSSRGAPVVGVIALVAALLTAASGGATAAGADIEAMLDGRVQELRRVHPHAAVTTSRGGPDRVGGEDVPALLDAAAEVTRPATYLHALELMLERHDLPVAVTTADRQMGAESAEPSGPSYQQTAAPTPVPVATETAGGGVAVPHHHAGGTTTIAGDLSGDGLDDVVQVSAEPPPPTPEGEEPPPATSTITALRGSDGAELWSASVTGGQYHGLAVQPVDDVAGDGAADLLVSVQQHEGFGEECGPDGCEFGESFTWRVQLHEGRTGAVAWERTYEGYVQYSHHGDGGTHDISHRVVNGFVPFQPVQDVSGDGVDDFVVTLTDERGSSTTTVEGSYPGTRTEVSRSSSTASTTVQVLDGVDASVVAELVEGDRPSVLAVEPVPDTTGDGIADVLLTRRQLPSAMRTCTYEGATRQCTEEGIYGGLDLELRTGPDLEAEWSRSYPLAHGAVSAPGDFTGDGVHDVALEGFAATGEGVLAVLAGDDGQEAWTRVSEDSFAYGGGGPLVATPVEADSALDLLTVHYRQLDDGRPAVEVVRRDGATGEQLLATLHATPAVESEHDYAYVAAFPAADADGDGTQDVFVFTERYDHEAGPSATTTVESGRTGEILTTIAHPTPHFGGGLFPAGDLDGDGGADAILIDQDGVHVGEGEEPPPPSMTAVRLRDGARLWEQPSPPHSYVFGASPARFDDDAGGDVLVHREVHTEAFFVSQAVAVDGADGSTLWMSPPPLDVRRIAGDDRVATAVALSAATYRSSDTVVVARAELFPDALAGGPLAAVLDAPLLLTGGGGLDPRTGAEIARLGAATAVVLGGPAALSPQVDADLAAAGLAVERLAGEDRYATAAAIADRMAAAGGLDDRVAVASGGGADPHQGWTDAIIASAYGATTRAPLLLVRADGIPEATAQALDRLAPDELILVGSGEAVTQATEAQLRTEGDRVVHRLFRDTPAATSRLVAEWVTDRGADPTAVWVATTQRFADALAASAAVGATRGVLLLTDGSAGSDIAEVTAYLDRYQPPVGTITLVGGPTAIAPEVEAAVADAVRPKS